MHSSIVSRPDRLKRTGAAKSREFLAKAKSYQEILYLRGYSIEDATKVTQRTFKLDKVGRI